MVGHIRMNVVQIIGEAGVFVFETSGDISQSPEGRCQLWTNRMQSNLSKVLPLARNLTACPCNGFQALLSPVHQWIPFSNCFVSLENLPVPQYVGMVSVKIEFLKPICLTLINS